jgi:hypothetical protein
VAGLVQTDAARLPFPAGSCPLVVSAFTHTDVEDFTKRRDRLQAVWRAGSASTSFPLPESLTACSKLSCGFVAWRKPD